MDKFFDLIGTWQGEYKLWLHPEAEVRKSASTLELSSILKGKYLRLDYSWDDSGPQFGNLQLTYSEQQKKINASWIDTWHMLSDILACEGYLTKNKIVIQGYYPAGEGPSWGWRTELAIEGEKLVMRMYNQTPQREEGLAVECKYTRIS